MHFTQITLLSAFVSLSQAGPLLSASAALITRQTTSFKNTYGIVIMCTRANWKGECVSLSVPTDGSCVEFPGPFFHNVSAIEPAFGTVCYRYSSANCSDICHSPSGCDMMVQFPGFANLSGGNWDKKIGSMECEVDYHTLER